jgi:hypothetical protein
LICFVRHGAHSWRLLAPRKHMRILPASSSLDFSGLCATPAAFA